jgi:hypothetical protein
MQVDQGDVQVANLVQGGLPLETQRGFSPHSVDFFAHVDGEDSACAIALRRSHRVTMADVATDPIFAGRAGGEVMLAAASERNGSRHLSRRGRAVRPCAMAGKPLPRTAAVASATAVARRAAGRLMCSPSSACTSPWSAGFAGLGALIVGAGAAIRLSWCQESGGVAVVETICYVMGAI